jgi:hypothetical protein
MASLKISPTLSILKRGGSIPPSAAVSTADHLRDFLFWSDETLSLEQFESVLRLLTEAERVEALESALKKEFGTLAGAAEANYAMQVSFVEMHLPFYQYLTRRFALFCCFLPQLFIESFVPGDAEFFASLRKLLRVAFGGSVFVGVWLFLNLPTALYLFSSSSSSYQLNLTICNLYYFYVFILSLPYCAREASYGCRSKKEREIHQSQRWHALSLRGVRKTDGEKITTTSFVIQATKIPASSFWAQQTPPLFVTVNNEARGRRDSLTDANQVAKRTNTYSQVRSPPHPLRSARSTPLSR